ncbi:SDR family NAD(P)-dependent oxidoreductase [Alcaligenaceae bacterium]|nr:SDR family NAD(P)-dependent oxidoreductase [Alcaligenaceae bacterium]
MNQDHSAEKGVVIVTGEASGIGLALAQGLLEEGWRVLAQDIRAESVRAARDTLRTRRPRPTLASPTPPAG